MSEPKPPRWARKAWLRKKVKEIMDSQDNPQPQPQNQARERLLKEKAALEQNAPPPMRLTTDRALLMILQRLSLLEVLVGRSHDALMHIIESAEAQADTQAAPPPGVEKPQESPQIPVDAPAAVG